MTNNLREALQERGMTIQELSLASGISDQTIRNVMRDPDAQVTPQTARKLLAGITDLTRGDYPIERFIESVYGIFPKAEILEWLASDLDATQD